MSERLNEVKKVIKDNFLNADCGLYNCRNMAGDEMTTIYEDDGIQVDICYDWRYYEVFGLTYAEFSELRAYYNELNEVEE